MTSEPIRFGIITASDRSSAGQRPDISGQWLVDEIKRNRWIVSRTTILPDDQSVLQETLALWADSGEIDIILTTGGTGFSPRDVTPEATLAIIDRLAPGIAEAMRSASLSITPHAMLSRAVAGIRKQTLIINLPGSPKAALENLATILPALPHAVQLLKSDPASEKGHKI
jgi:molybdenum cofactor synthesis domain-containing protein